MKRLALCFSVFAILLLPAALVHADEPVRAGDYVLDVGDGRYVFVMLASDSAVIDTIQDKEIRAKYDQSGLYQVDVTDPIWSVDWYAFQVDITPDGRHLVRWGPWPALDDYDALALEFYEDGNLLRSYQVSDLVAAPQRLPRTASHLTWKANAKFDGQNKELYLETENGEAYLFDVTTGDVIEKKASFYGSFCPPLGGILLLGPAGGFFIRKRGGVS